jgi:hypothetical protein
MVTHEYIIYVIISLWVFLAILTMVTMFDGVDDD